MTSSNGSYGGRLQGTEGMTVWDRERKGRGTEGGEAVAKQLISKRSLLIGIEIEYPFLGIGAVPDPLRLARDSGGGLIQARAEKGSGPCRKSTASNRGRQSVRRPFTPLDPSSGKRHPRPSASSADQMDSKTRSLQ